MMKSEFTLSVVGDISFNPFKGDGTFGGLVVFSSIPSLLSITEKKHVDIYEYALYQNSPSSDEDCQ